MCMAILPTKHQTWTAWQRRGCSSQTSILDQLFVHRVSVVKHSYLATLMLTPVDVAYMLIFFVLQVSEVTFPTFL